MRVAVTNPIDRSKRLCAAIASEGLIPVPLPCVEVTPADASALDEARQVAATASLLVVSSSRVIEMLWSSARMPSVDVVAVGPVTAAAVREAGGNVVFVGSGGAADLEPFVSERPQTIVHLAASNGVQLRVPGIRRVAVYETMPVSPALTPVDAVAFTSPSAVAGWTSVRSVAGLSVGAIGETTASALAPFDCDPVVPDEPSYEALARVLSVRSTKTKESA